MSCIKFEKYFTEYISGNLTRNEREALENHLTECETCRLQLEQMKIAWEAMGNIPEETPSHVLRSRFYRMLEEERRKVTKQTVPFQKIQNVIVTLWPKKSVVQIAFSLGLFIFGLIVGTQIRINGQHSGEMALLRQEINEMRQMVSLTLMSRGSSSERLSGINYLTRMDHPAESLLENLLDMLNSDPNVNVRLAVVDALLIFSHHPGVRDALVASLSRQSSPLVQIALIDLLVQIQEKTSLEALKNLIDNQEMDQTVKQYAEKQLEELI